MKKLGKLLDEARKQARAAGLKQRDIAEFSYRDGYTILTDLPRFTHLRQDFFLARRFRNLDDLNGQFDH